LNSIVKKIKSIFGKKKTLSQKKVRLTKNQVDEIIEMANQEREVLRVESIVKIMLNDYDNICYYIEYLKDTIEELFLEIERLENSLVNMSIKNQ
tara:strand:+ start:383 stop:664 length:282 start_codon:yes stop_codon:yes gene_type:complete